MRLNTRLDRLESRLTSPAGKFVFLSADMTGRRSPIERSGIGVSLNVPWEFEADPDAGLTDDQRAAIGPHDIVLWIAYVDDWRGDRRPRRQAAGPALEALHGDRCGAGGLPAARYDGGAGRTEAPRGPIASP